MEGQGWARPSPPARRVPAEAPRGRPRRAPRSSEALRAAPAELALKEEEEPDEAPRGGVPRCSQPS
eukprot:9167681-Pyramimonas_sp.AAC.1